MHSAPAVSYPVGRSRFQGWLVGLTGIGGTAIGLFWCYAVNPGGWRQWLYATTLLGFCVAAVAVWRRSPPGRLRWDGQAWNWSAMDASACGVLIVHLDFQSCLLLSFCPEKGPRLWLWPERGTDVLRWNALRCAVFSHSDECQAQDASIDAH